MEGKKGAGRKAQHPAEVNVANSKLLEITLSLTPAGASLWRNKKGMRLTTSGQVRLRNTAGGFGHGCGSTRTFCPVERAQA